MPDWHWEPVTDDLLDALPPAARAAVRQIAEELTVRESMIFLDGREFTQVARSTPYRGDHRMPATERYRRQGLICQAWGRRVR